MDGGNGMLKRRRWSGPLTLIFLFAMLFAQTANGQSRRRYPSPWTEIKSPVKQTLHLVHFLDDSTGWALTDSSGLLLGTHDGGLSWTIDDTLAPGYYEVLTTTRDGDLWIAGERGTLLVRHPGSDTFIHRGALQERYSIYGFLPVYGRGEDSASVKLFIGGIEARSDGPHPLLARSKTWGRTWEQLGSQVPGRAVAGLAESPLGFIFAAAGGTLLTSFTGSPGTWIPTYKEPGDSLVLRDIVIDQVQNGGAVFGLAVGHSGLMIATFNGGRSWQRIPPFTGNRLRRALVLDSQTGWVVGDGILDPGVCWITTDRAATWQNVQLPYNDISLHDIAATSTALVTVGTGGTILRMER